MQTLRRRLTKNDEGFTLIELMVVVLIIAILIAIAIPTFLGAQNRARDRGAQSDLRNALTAAKTVATDAAGAFMVGTEIIDAADMLAAEPSLTFNDLAATTTSIRVSTAAAGASITLEKLSASGTSFGISATDDGVVTYCRGAAAGNCADPAAGFTATPW